jgi:hypothetical protein
MRWNRRPVVLSAVAIVALLVSSALLAGLPRGGGEQAVASPATSPTTWIVSPSAMANGSPTDAATPTGAATPLPGPTFGAVDVFATPTPTPAKGALPTDQVDAPAPRRPLPAQSEEWLRLKAAGRIALVDGKVVILDAATDPMIDPVTGARVPEARTLETDYARWIIEPLGYGRDAKGNSFSDRNMWNLCESGAPAAALYYWQQLTGRPNVTGLEGWFLDPYAAEGVAWPSPGPTVVRDSHGNRIGTYWTGTDHVNGYTAHGRGYIMYLGMQVQLPGWASRGMPTYADSKGRPIYPTIGAPRTTLQAVMNWEVAGHDESAWAEYWYASVMRFDPTALRDLSAAVTLDVGRDGVPVVMELDTHGLPNWQNGSKTRHVRHAVTIVGYDNTASPPTFTYLDTCGRACNSKGGNQNGQIHVISQAQMVKAMQDTVGSGFIW